MQVSLNSALNYPKSPYFAAKKADTQTQKSLEYTPTKDEIITAKTKKAISECKYVVLGAGILYFAMKHNIKVNKIKNLEKKAAELAKMKVPTPHLMNVNIDELNLLGLGV